MGRLAEGEEEPQEVTVGTKVGRLRKITEQELLIVCNSMETVHSEQSPAAGSEARRHSVMTSPCSAVPLRNIPTDIRWTAVIVSYRPEPHLNPSNATSRFTFIVVGTKFGGSCSPVKTHACIYMIRCSLLSGDMSI